MKRVLSLLMVVPAAAGILALSGCGDGVEPFPPTPTVAPTDTPTTAPTRTRTNTATVMVVATNTPTNVVLTNTPTTGIPTRTPTITDTPNGDPPTETPTQAATETPTLTPTSGTAICGNGAIEPPEECDDGDNYTVTTACEGEAGPCCAANCTVEIVPELVLDLGTTETTQSLTTVRSALFDIPLNIAGKVFIHAGKPTGPAGTTGADGFSNFSPGEVPVGSLIEDSQLPPIEVPGIACACVRGVAVKSCGGRPLVPAGDVLDCTNDESVCPESEPCKFTHGEGAFSSGVIGCDGLEDVDYVVTVNSQLPDGDPNKTHFVRSGGLAAGGAGFVYNSTAIATIIGDCGEDKTNPDKGPDGLPCTEDDPNKGEPSTIPQTTGSTTSIIKTSAGGTLACTVPGHSISCENIPNTAGLSLAQAFATEDVDIVGDVAICGVFAGL